MFSESHLMVSFNPSSKFVSGFQPSNSRAFLLSHHNLSTSLSFGLIRFISVIIFFFLPVKDITFLAISPMDISKFENAGDLNRYLAKLEGDVHNLDSALRSLVKLACGVNPAQDLGEDAMGRPLTDEQIIEQAKLTASLLERSSGQRMISAGWRYRNKKTGLVTLTEQPPDRMLFIDDFEVTELFANEPVAPASAKGEGEAKREAGTIAALQPASLQAQSLHVNPAQNLVLGKGD